MFTVKDLLALNSFQGSQIVAGSAYIYNEVQNLSVMEVPDIKDYVKKGDFLVTTLYPLVNNEEKMQSIISDLAMAGISGIGIKLNRYIYNIPIHFVEHANEQKVPLIILPENANFSVQINEFLLENNQRKTKELEYRNKLHEHIIDIISSKSDYEYLRDSMSNLLGMRVELFNKHAKALSLSNSDVQDVLYIQNILKSLSTKDSSKDLFELELTNNNRCYIYTIIFNRACIGYIAVYPNSDETLKEESRLAIEQFSLAYRILYLRDKDIKQVEQRYLEEFIFQLLSGKLRNEGETISRAQALGWNLSFPISIMLLDISANHSLNKKNVEERLRLYLNMKTLFKNQESWGYFVVYTGAYIVLFLDSNTSEQYEELCKHIFSFFDSIKVRDYYIGISQKAHNIDNIQKIYWQGEKALSVAKMIKNKHVMHFNETGIYRIIMDATNFDDLVDFCNDKIGKIIEYDEVHNSDLLNTLSMLIENGLNVNSTSKAMFVHYNTIRYRKSLIEDLIHASLDSINYLQDMSFALKIYDVLKFRKY